MEYYSEIYLDTDVLFVNKIPFLLATIRDIGFIHIKALVSTTGKRIQNGLLQIVLDYENRGFKIISMFGDRMFGPLINWARIELKVDLVICAPESHVPSAENTIQFVKERVRSIQSETPFKRYPRRFTIELMRRAVVLINSFRRKSGVHSVMSPRQILFGKKFKTPLCKIGELVIAYNTTSDNKTTTPRAFYALYIGPNNGGTGHQVFKLSN